MVGDCDGGGGFSERCWDGVEVYGRLDEGRKPDLVWIGLFGPR